MFLLNVMFTRLPDVDQILPLKNAIDYFNLICKLHVLNDSHYTPRRFHSLQYRVRKQIW